MLGQGKPNEQQTSHSTFTAVWDVCCAYFEEWFIRCYPIGIAPLIDCKLVAAGAQCEGDPIKGLFMCIDAICFEDRLAAF
jgi:hypothetical protein